MFACVCIQNACAYRVRDPGVQGGGDEVAEGAGTGEREDEGAGDEAWGRGVSAPQAHLCTRCTVEVSLYEEKPVTADSTGGGDSSVGAVIVTALVTGRSSGAG